MPQVGLSINEGLAPAMPATGACCVTGRRAVRGLLDSGDRQRAWSAP